MDPITMRDCFLLPLCFRSYCSDCVYGHRRTSNLLGDKVQFQYSLINVGRLIFALTIIGNYALAVAIVISIPIVCKIRYSIIFTVMMYLFGLASIGFNIAFIVLFLIKAGKHIGSCYTR
jgi:hypothetical protein